MPNKLAEDWVALWQSELTAMAADRELRESWVAMVGLWAGAAHSALAMVRAHEPPAGAAGPAQPPGPAPAAAAPGAGVAEIRRLNRRIAALEHRLATIERKPGGA